jgi:hypothetical protein
MAMRLSEEVCRPDGALDASAFASDKRNTNATSVDRSSDLLGNARHLSERAMDQIDG